MDQIYVFCKVTKEKKGEALGGTCGGFRETLWKNTLDQWNEDGHRCGQSRFEGGGMTKKGVRELAVGA